MKMTKCWDLPKCILGIRRISKSTARKEDILQLHRTPSHYSTLLSPRCGQLLHHLWWNTCVPWEPSFFFLQVSFSSELGAPPLTSFHSSSAPICTSLILATDRVIYDPWFSSTLWNLGSQVLFCSASHSQHLTT